MSASIVVIKFGGTSVSSRESWESIAEIVRAHLLENKRVIVVCSAMSGVSNQLSALCKQAINQEHESLFETLAGKHMAFAEELSVSAAQSTDIFNRLSKNLQAVSMLQELSPRTEAAAMASGERALTSMGAEFLAQALGEEVSLVDATQWLKSVSSEHERAETHYLSAICEATPCDKFRSSILEGGSRVFLTQGFIASNEQGEVVLLGRGGSDVSAAYIAAACRAEFCEIWTDVAGIYTANPRQVASARVIRYLSYDEAQEIAAMGGKVLHPNALPPVKKNNIPLRIKQASAAHEPGTFVSSAAPTAEAAIKCVSTKKQVTLISIEGVNMWRSVGFLAEVFSCFAQHGLSVDLMSTAESCVTVSLDTAANLLGEVQLNALLADLNGFAEASVIFPCATVSLLGEGIRSILPDLSEVFAQFGSKKVYMMSQAANDLNLTFVVDEAELDKLSQQIHHLLIDNQPMGELFLPAPNTQSPDRLSIDWVAPALSALASEPALSTPSYLYSEKIIQAQLNLLQSIQSVDKLFYAIKANPHPDIIRLVHAKGASLECVSQGEIEHVLNILPGLDPSEILFTPNFAPKNEYVYAFEKGVKVTIDGAYPLVHWPELFVGQSVCVRMDPGQGRGHHKHVMTAGQSAKFGTTPDEMQVVLEAAKTIGARIVGLHAHAGSGINDPVHWFEIVSFLSDFFHLCPDLKFVNCGGGLGIPQLSWQSPLDLKAVDAHLAKFKKAYPDLELWMEPGRFLVAEAGVLLARVTQVKSKGSKTYVGVETGMNSLIRPALYGAYHPIVNLTQHGKPLTLEATIVGPICESADILGHDRLLPETREGDVLAIGLAGAYGECMGSAYNHRLPAKGVLHKV